MIKICTCSSRKFPSIKSVICGSHESSAVLCNDRSFSFTNFSRDSVSSIAVVDETHVGQDHEIKYQTKIPK